MPDDAGSDDFQISQQILHDNDRDLYLASLLTSPESVRDIIVLRAYHAELTKIVRSTAELLAGEIRLRWWADVFSGLRDSEGTGHPLARVLKDMLRRHDLSPQPLFAKAEAHIAELYSDPFDTLGTLEGHLGETHSTQLHMASEIAGASADRTLADACGHAGVAMGLTDLLLNMAFHRRHSRCFVPEAILDHHALPLEEFLKGSDSRHQAVIHHMEREARVHLAEARNHLKSLNSKVHPVFKPLALIPAQLKRIHSDSATVLVSGLPPFSQLRIQWTLWRG